MSFDWDKFKEDAQKAAEQAGDKTDEVLASKISSVSRLTDEEIKQLFPKPADTAKLAELLSVVKSATEHNQKIAYLQRNIANYADIIVKLVNKAV